MSGRYIRQEPYVNDYGIYVPDKEYVPEDCVSTYRCIMTKEMFVEAYNKWIKGEPDVFDNPFYSQDDADCWSE
jgi:hypothetical protein